MNRDTLIQNYIEALKKNPGLKPEDFLVSESDKETLSMLRITQSLMSIPKKPVPEPVMQRKFMLSPLPAKHVRFFLRLSRFTALGISAAVLALVTLTSYAASNSLPGEKLFTLKRAAEQVQLQFTSDPVKKANLQLSFTQRRITEAQTVFSNPDNSGLETAAMNALSEQTKTAADEVKTVAVAKKANPPLVASLQEVDKKQKDLIDQVKQSTQSETINSGVLATAQADQVQLNEIIKIVAANTDESPATLNSPAATTSTSTTATVSTSTPPQTVTPSTTTPAQLGTTTPSSTGKRVGSEPVVPIEEDSNTAIGTFIPEGPNQ